MTSEAGTSGLYVGEEEGIPIPTYTLSDEKEQVGPVQRWEGEAKDVVQSLRELYASLDRNRDGRIDIKELTQALREHSPHLPSSYAQVSLLPQSSPAVGTGAAGLGQDWMTKADLNDSSTVSFKELVHYVMEHEKRLAVVFSSLDKNRNGPLPSPSPTPALTLPPCRPGRAGGDREIL